MELSRAVREPRDSLTLMVNGHPASRLVDLLPWQVGRATAEMCAKQL